MIKNRKDSSCGIHFLRDYNRIYVSLPPLSPSSASFYPLPVKCKCNVIQQNWSVTIQAMEINPGTKIETLKKRMFS